MINVQPALSQVLVKKAADGTETYYVHGLGLIGQEQNGEYLSYHFDYRGSTVALTDETGSVVERFLYSPYGLLLSGDASITPFLFNGMYGVMTDDNGLYYMRARYYSPEIRRFVNQDILLGDIFDGQTLNRYAFVTGQPVSFIDPFGLSEEGVEEPGLAESLIPIWGSGKAAMFYYQNGQWFWGTVNVGLAISDVFLVKALAIGTVKGCLGIVAKGGGQTTGVEWLIKAATEARQKINPGMLKDFSSSELGRSSGHARAKHGWKVNDSRIIDVRNNPDKIYVGVNENGNHVVIFWKDGDVVITDAADTTSVITAYGKSAPKNASYQRDKWVSNSSFSEIVPTSSQCGCDPF